MSRRKKGYTVLKAPHECPLPSANSATQGTVVQCDECRTYWVKSGSQWLETMTPNLSVRSS